MRKNRINPSTMLNLAIALFLFTTSCTKTLQEEIKSETENAAKPEPLPNPNAKQYTLVPDKEGRLVVDGKAGKYKPGDVINLKGTFSSILFTDLNGNAGNPIIIRNAPGTVLKVGNPNWNGGSWSTAFSFRNSHYIKVGGINKSDIQINGSTQPNRDAYFGLALAQRSDNFEVYNMTINNGGTGIWAKTEAVKDDPNTYDPNVFMQNLKIHNVTIIGAFNEAMYIGHTATYWNLNTNAPVYDLPAGAVVGSVYVRPIKWRNVKIYNNVIKNIGLDGLQASAIDNLEIYGNNITNWGLQKNPSHSGGLLVGGRVTNSNVHDNVVHDGWGELFQFFGSGANGATHVVRNNLFYNNFANDGVNLRGTDNAVVQFTNNTVSRTVGVSVRINGHLGMTANQIINANALIQPRMGGGTVDARAFIYAENGAKVTEGTGSNANTKFTSVAAAGVDVNNYYQPKSGSALLSSGFRMN